MTVVLDTNVVSALMRRDLDVLERLRFLNPSQVVLVSPVAAELRFGIERLVPGSRRRRLLEREYQTIRAVLRRRDWDEEASTLFGRIKASLASAGTPIEDMDIAIAATALSMQASLATRNVRHFDRIPGLQVDDWGE